jgi:hypothetical protein
MSTITGIPAADVGKVVQDFIDDGAAHVLVEQGPDGTYNVTAS